MKRVSIRVVLSGVCIAMLLAGMCGCKQSMMETVFPSVFGEDAVLGETQQERLEPVYGHIAIDLPSSFSLIGSVDIMWAPAMRVEGLVSPQYLSSTFYGHSGVYYVTQWTQLGTDTAYFVALMDETTSRWNREWEERTYVVPSNTANHEYAQYFEYLKQHGKKLAARYRVVVYAKRFSGRVMVRVLEFTPSDESGNPPEMFQHLYPLQPYATVSVP
ncbi:MAG: hypothetical protein MI749_09505 [Desulfovibrionales bacterium]|nr:hypothetical protein [Desulfovibrionales bacterium]